MLALCLSRRSIFSRWKNGIGRLTSISKEFYTELRPSCRKCRHKTSKGAIMVERSAGTWAILLSIAFAASHLDSQERVNLPMPDPVSYGAVKVDGLSIFYREAGPKDGPTMLLLHGLPSSSRMFEPLFARLSERYHLIAPDYPGFGHSDWPDPKTFAYRSEEHTSELQSHSFISYALFC